MYVHAIQWCMSTLALIPIIIPVPEYCTEIHVDFCTYHWRIKAQVGMLYTYMSWSQWE